MKRVAPLLLPALLAACSPVPADNQNFSVMARFDPSITTLAIEQARNTARYAEDTVALSPGKYCQGFVNVFGKDSATARMELTILPGRQYQLASRYTYRNLVQTSNAVGNFITRGHAVIFVNKAGEENTWAVTRSDSRVIKIWGSLPLSRAACTEPPLQGQALTDATRIAREEQAIPASWDVKSEDDNVK